MPVLRNVLFCVITALCSLALSGNAMAQDTLALEIQGPGQARMNIVQSKPFADGNMPADAQYLNELIRKNLAFMPFLKVMSDSDILGGATLPGPKAEQIDFKPFSLAKVDLLVTSVWKPGKGLGDVELRAFEVYSQKLLLGKVYSSVTRDQLPEVADRFCMELMALLTGQGTIFKAKLAFVKPSGKGKDIWTVGGHGPRPGPSDALRRPGHGHLPGLVLGRRAHLLHPHRVHFALSGHLQRRQGQRLYLALLHGHQSRTSCPTEPSRWP